ncbi:uncharacterized protein KRP23_8637 [Phytophthora ramorum]|uniref:uncharacterized protein n=1 Tax=Phytophthora ramorum TaxID=164328 RepID=UPI0030AAC195|nr:hypothetical protein KRP23_8637 [Phytophthora ramorum]
MNESNARRARRREVALPYEKTYPWEDERGSTVERTVEVNTEAKRMYAQQEQLLPTLALDKPSDPAAAEHLQNVGRCVLLLRDTTKRARKKNGPEHGPKLSPKRVIPSRFPEITPDVDEEDAGEPDRVEEEEDPVVTDGRIATMLMDQEWDTRAWNTVKVRTAVDTLYEEIEHSEDDSRRELATTMLLRLLETHEDAVDYVETTLPSLTNKAFQTLSKLTNNTKIFRMARLVAVLAEWFAHVLSSENAAKKSHHWRGVIFERTVNQRDYDPIVRTRLRSMHMIKFVELRHQFKVFREAIGPGGIPSSVTQAYITILYHLVKPQHDANSISDKTHNTVISDQRRILGSGVLVFIASLITKRQSREVIELVKGIVLEIVEGHGDEQIVEILQCNVVQRCNRLDEIEGLVARSSSEDRFIHQLGSKEACKALSRLARCPSNLVDARLRPSVTSPQVPEWPQALICDVMFRMHVLEDLIALIRNPSDAVEFAQVELDKVVAAVELTGYIRPLPYGESARDKFLKTHANHPHGIFSQEKLLQLVELVAPAILHVLREKSIGFDLVSACCVALSRLACTNAARSLLLAQGCLQTTLIHLPEILIATTMGKSSPKHQTVEFDSSVDDHGLLDVPAALYTLFGKLCAVADGRTGIMRAQVLPRLLKRMQLRHPTSRILDDECKSEIAVVIARLAMVNSVEGSTSELFLHFRVLELLTNVLKQHRGILLGQFTIASASKKTDEVKRWRLLVHAVGAIAALSQDVLVCVPRVVALGIVELLFPFLMRLGNPNPHLVSLQYDAVTIIRSIASFPFGEYHTYLTNVNGTDLDSVSSDEKKKLSSKGDKSVATTSPTIVMERVKQIGYDFAMELQNKPMALRDKKSVGELARETMAFINEHHQQQQRQLEQQRKSIAISITGSKDQHLGRSTVAGSPIHRGRASFPALPQSPLSRLDEISGSRSSPVVSRSTEATVPATPTSSAPSILVLDGGSKSPVSLNGVKIASTRPPGNNKPRPSSESPHNHHHYVFTRPKAKTKRRDQDPAYCLMLDPLFDSGSASMNSRRLPSSNVKITDEAQQDEVLNPCSFSQEVDHFGHYVNVQARRSKKGDRYFPSLGRIVASDTTFSPLSPKPGVDSPESKTLQQTRAALS